MYTPLKQRNMNHVKLSYSGKTDRPTRWPERTGGVAGRHYNPSCVWYVPPKHERTPDVYSLKACSWWAGFIPYSNWNITGYKEGYACREDDEQCICTRSEESARMKIRIHVGGEMNEERSSIIYLCHLTFFINSKYITLPFKSKPPWMKVKSTVSIVFVRHHVVILLCTPDQTLPACFQ